MLCDGEALSAYVSLRDEATAAALDAVREYLARQLPAVMLPRTLQALPRLPRLGNGKLDRQALRQVGNEPAAGLLAPRDALETVIAQRMAQLLGLEQVGIEQDFLHWAGIRCWSSSWRQVFASCCSATSIQASSSTTLRLPPLPRRCASAKPTLASCSSWPRPVCGSTA